MFAASIHDYLCASFGERGFDVGAFCVSYDKTNVIPYVNYGVPRTGVTPTARDVELLCEWLIERERAPRLEFVPEGCPSLEPLLIAAGFTEEIRSPVLTWDPGSAPVVVAPIDGIEVRLATTDAELAATVSAQDEAYGEPARDDPDAGAGLRRLLDRGGLVCTAVDTVSGLAVGGAVCPPPHHGISEIAGVGVRSAYRRRGIASAIVHCLATRGPEVGITSPFIGAADEAVARIYEGVGFRRTTEMLHISRR